MSNSEVSAESQSLESRDGLRAEFVKQDDRYATRISLLAPRAAARLLVSVEQISEPVPAYQELHKQTNQATGDIYFLTGMSLKNYWSACVSLPAGGGLLFDVACRCAGGREGLAVVYRVLPSMRAQLDESGAVVLLHEGSAAARLTPWSADDSAACRAELADDRVLLYPAEAAASTGPARMAFVVTASGC